MKSVFETLSQLVQKVRDGKGGIATDEFLSVCLHIIPIIGEFRVNLP